MNIEEWLLEVHDGTSTVLILREHFVYDNPGRDVKDSAITFEKGI
jgi:hypothetical protein